MHIAADGTLTIHPIGVDKICRDWAPTRTQTHVPWLRRRGRYAVRHRAAGRRNTADRRHPVSVPDAEPPARSSVRPLSRVPLFVAPAGARTPRRGCTSTGEPSASSRTTTESFGTLCPTTRPSPSGVVTRRADRWARRPGTSGVQRMFVLEAAHQPAARAGDAQRVEWQILVLGHPDGDRLEVGQERGAAQVAAARADAALDPGRIAGGELAQLDPAVQGGAQVADQGAEVDPVRAR